MRCMRQLQRIRLMCGVTCFSDDLKEATKSLFVYPYSSDIQVEAASSRLICWRIELPSRPSSCCNNGSSHKKHKMMPAMTHCGHSLASGPPSQNNRPRAAFDTAVLTLQSYCTLSTVICRTVSVSRRCK